MDPAAVAALSAIGGAGIGALASLGGQLISNRAQRSGRRRQEQVSEVTRQLQAAHRVMNAWTDLVPHPSRMGTRTGDPDVLADALAAALSELLLATDEVLLLAPQLKVEAEALRSSVMPEGRPDGPVIVRYQDAGDALIEKARKTLPD